VKLSIKARDPWARRRLAKLTARLRVLDASLKLLSDKLAGIGADTLPAPAEWPDSDIWTLIDLTERGMSPGDIAEDTGWDLVRINHQLAALRAEGVLPPLTRQVAPSVPGGLRHPPALSGIFVSAPKPGQAASERPIVTAARTVEAEADPPRTGVAGPPVFTPEVDLDILESLAGGESLYSVASRLGATEAQIAWRCKLRVPVPSPKNQQAAILALKVAIANHADRRAAS
jgi:hypothetical protein